VDKIVVVEPAFADHVNPVPATSRYLRRTPTLESKFHQRLTNISRRNKINATILPSIKREPPKKPTKSN